MFINDRQLIEKVVTEMSKFLDIVEADFDAHCSVNNIERWKEMLSGRAVGAFEIPNEE